MNHVTIAAALALLEVAKKEINDSCPQHAIRFLKLVIDILEKKEEN